MTDPSIRILFVCTANVCRSPMAAAFMALHAELNNAPISVSSASVAREQRSLHPMVIKILKEHNLQLSRTTSQPLSNELVNGADLVLTMTADHAVWVVGQFPAAKAKVFVLGHFAQIVTRPPSDDGLEGWLDATRGHARGYSRLQDTWDVQDPMGEDETTFRSIARQLDELTAWIATVLSHGQLRT